MFEFLDKTRLSFEDVKWLYIDKDEALDVEKIVINSFHPLKGFMDREDLESVCEKMTLKDGKNVWTIPILLQISKDNFNQLSKNDEVLLIDKTDNNKIAILRVEDLFKLDKERIAKKIFGTTDINHPGVKKLYSKGDYAVGGEIIKFLNHPNFPNKEFELTPAETKEVFSKRKWKKIVGFQTRNPPHRAHEYLQKLGIEIGDGLFINPIIGYKKKGDFDSKVILEAYKILIEHYFPKEKVLLSGLSTSMRYAGPREAVFHAIIRRNYGCTHFMVGRDHAGVGNFYDPYDAHRIFDNLPQDIGIEIIKFHDVFFCKKCEEMVSEKICPHSEEEIYKIKISMTKIREILKKGEYPSPNILRKEIAEFLVNNINLIEEDYR